MRRQQRPPRRLLLLLVTAILASSLFPPLPQGWGQPAPRVGPNRQPFSAEFTVGPLPTPPKRRVIAAQISHSSATSWAELAREVDGLRVAGINTLIVRVFQNRYNERYPFLEEAGAPVGVYFRTDAAPLVADLLGPFTELAHSRGLRVYAWMTTRHADWLRDDHPDWYATRYDINRSRWESSDRLSVFHPAVLPYLERLFADLARYPIDGVLFQDDWVLRHNEDFSPHAREAALRDLGIEVDPASLYAEVLREEEGARVASYSDLFWRWSAWKARRLGAGLERLVSAMQQVNPHLDTAVNLYYETLLQPRWALAWMSQDLAALGPRCCNSLAVMSYHRQIQEELGLGPAALPPLLAQLTRSAARLRGDPKGVIMKVQTWDWRLKQEIEEQELEGVVRAMTEAAPVGLAFFPGNDAALLSRLIPLASPRGNQVAPGPFRTDDGGGPSEQER